MKNCVSALSRIFCLSVANSLFSQNLIIKPFKLISQKNDTVLTELNIIRVPIDRTTNSSDSISLHFVRLKSTNPNPGSPIIYLAGGPGSSGIETAKGKRFPIFMKLREAADVIILDQRGTGLSNTLPNCPYKSVFDSSKPLDKAQYVEETRLNIEKCLNFWKEKNVNIWAYNTTENAKDLDDVRKSLKIEKISFWGISYGSHLAFEYIRLFENRIDKMALASLEGPEESIKFPKQSESFLFQIAALSENNFGSDIKYPSLKEKMVTVHNRLKAKPIVVNVKNRQGKVESIGISNFELQSAVATFYMKNPEDSKKIPKLYSKMYNGDFDEIASWVLIMKKYVLNGIQPMAFAMDMKSGISKSRSLEVKKQIDKTILGSTINFLFYEWMNVIKYDPLPDSFRKMKKNTVSALLISGTQDGRTYLSSGIDIAKKFKNGRHIIVENGGHDIYEQSEEVAKEVIDFFNNRKNYTNRIVLSPTKFD